MTIDPKRFALAITYTMVISFVLCRIAFLLWPAEALQLSLWMMHMTNAQKYASDIDVSFTSFIAGLIQILLYSYIGGWLVAWFYNRSRGK